MPIRFSLLTILVLGQLANVNAADSPSAPSDKVQKETRKFNQFGPNLDYVAKPAMRDAVQRLNEAGVISGRRGSLTFFRWTNTEPPRLAHLGLWGSNVTNQLLALTPLLEDLEYVALYETSVDDEGIRNLLKLPKLRRLSILPIERYEKEGFGPTQWSYPFMKVAPNRPQITGKSLQAFTAVSSLEGLELLDAKLTSRDLQALRQWPKLSSLSLPNRIDAETVTHLQSCKRLNALTLGHREISRDELQNLGNWKMLRKLSILHSTLSAETLQGLSLLESVEELHLEDCGLKDEHLANLRKPPKLTHLSLKRNEICGPGMMHLETLGLTSLGLEFNNLRNDTLASLTPLSSLERLSLAYCRLIDDNGIRSGELLKMKHLKHLNLRGLQGITDATLDDLIKYGHLDHINVRETKVSLEGVARMKKAMPKTDVFK